MTAPLISPAWLLTIYCTLVVLASLSGGWLLIIMRPTHTRLQVAISFVDRQSGKPAGTIGPLVQYVSRLSERKCLSAPLMPNCVQHRPCNLLNFLLGQILALRQSVNLLVRERIAIPADVKDVQ